MSRGSTLPASREELEMDQIKLLHQEELYSNLVVLVIFHIFMICHWPVLGHVRNVFTVDMSVILLVTLMILSHGSVLYVEKYIGITPMYGNLTFAVKFSRK